MGVVSFKHRGNFNNLDRFLKGAAKLDLERILQSYGEEGVRALSSATPIDSGDTAGSWGYKIQRNRASYSIIWTNSNVNEGIPIAILIQYGHGTSNGGYVQGRDFINPALQPIFDQIANSVWQEVIKL